MEKNKNNKKNKKHIKPILNPKWLRICQESVRNMAISFDEKRTLLYLIWKEFKGNCGCSDEHKLGKYCDNCGKHLYKRENRSAQAIITEQVRKQ